MGTLAAGIKEIFETTKQSGTNVMLCGNDGTPDGHMTMAKLGETLGVPKRLEFVDLGLPSGTLWATRNLGAETPEDYGYYFSWGNVVGRKPNGTTFDYNWGTDNNGNYASTPGAALTGDIPTNMDYDAVQRYMGGSCKMPTTTQFAELFNSSYTTNEWTTKNGVNGRLVTSKINGNSIFFPAAGFGNGTSLYGAGSDGVYWSRSLCSSANGDSLNFNSSLVVPQGNNGRFYGFSVRAVQ